jgi:hypothetical protein
VLVDVIVGPRLGMGATSLGISADCQRERCSVYKHRSKQAFSDRNPRS